MLDQVTKDLLSPDFVKQLTREAMKYREAHQSDPAQNQRTDIVELETRISKMMEMASNLENPAPALREVDKLENTRNALLSEIGRLETEYTAASMLDNISETKIKLFLQGIAENMESLSREALKDFLTTVIGQVTLDPASHECQIDYQLASIWGIRWRPQGDSRDGLFILNIRGIRQKWRLNLGVPIAASALTLLACSLEGATYLIVF